MKPNPPSSDPAYENVIDFSSMEINGHKKHHKKEGSGSSVDSGEDESNDSIESDVRSKSQYSAITASTMFAHVAVSVDCFTFSSAV